AFVAAYFQWLALRDERRSAAEDAVESRFFRLVESLQNAVNVTRVGEYEGKQAMRKVLETAIKLGKQKRTTLGKGTAVSDEKRRADINRWFMDFYHGEYDEGGNEKRYRAGDLLGHLFRLTYHIVKYVDEAEAADEDDKLFYIRILRAHLSNPELVLLMYNALAEYGYPTMYKLIEQHDLLQNIDPLSLPDMDDAVLFPKLREKVAAYKAKLAQQQPTS
ncbi:MAG TPA: putative phage abortive infection protein, partial [Tepidisphaeraceae bacterium]